MTQAQTQPLIINLNSDSRPTQIESYCVACHQNGQTILLLTQIPFFKEVLIGSFNCNNCGNRNNQVQFVGELPPRGVDITFEVREKEDLNREFIKSEFAQIKISELGLEIPMSKRAEITTVQGLLLKIENNLSLGQQERKLVDQQSFQKIEVFIQRVKRFRQGFHMPFQFNLYDPSGNSNIKNPYAPKLDQRITFKYFNRSKQQLEIMGYSQENANEQLRNKNDSGAKQQIPVQNTDGLQIKKVDFNQPVTEKDFLHSQPSMFEILCHSCNMPGFMKLCQTNIPHFTDLIIMSFSCQFCGAHSTDTKTSGAISDKSISIKLNVRDASDLKREIYKSESCYIKIPEVQLELDYGTLGGAYTTVEGLLQKITDHMRELNAFSDSDDDFSVRMRALINTLQQMREGKRQFTLILEDPLSNSFLQNPYHPEQDKNAERIQRERTADEIDFLGLNEMSV